eukprot:Em0023g474a
MVILSGIVWFVPIPEEGVTYEETAARFEGLGVSSASQTEAPIEDPNQSQHLPQPEQFNPHLDSPADVKVDVPKASVEEPGGAARVDHTTAVPAGSSHESNVVTEETAASDEQNKHGKEDTARRRKVVEMIKLAWDGYEKYAWGENELSPMSKRGHSASVFGTTAMGATIVDSLDTLYIAGLTEEFNRATEWVKSSLDISKVYSDVSVFEYNIRFVGGLLSAYALSKNEMFLKKAEEVAIKLLPAFGTSTGIPYAIINPATGSAKNWGWASGGSSILAEFGSLHLEFQYLTYATKKPVYLEKVETIRKRLKELDKPDGLYSNFVNPHNGQWASSHMSIGALGDSFYEYLLKSWLGTSKADTEARDMYYAAVDSILNKLVRISSNGLTMLVDLRNGMMDGKMQHLACFAGGMLALGGAHAINGNGARYLEAGKEVTRTCHESYRGTASKLGAEAFEFEGNDPVTRTNERMYLLRPETVESFFVMWRLTHNQMYRDWGWEVVQALEEQCKTDAGYSGIRDVYSNHGDKDDVQQSFFLAETLKYLLLLFSDDSVIPLDSWVFNTEAHPFPVLPTVPQRK